jgi:prolipoprotein diacylglyceryltransferase
MLLCLVIFAVLWKLRFKLTRPWTLALLFLSMYSFGRIFIFIFRENAPFLFGLKEGQVIAIATLLVCLALLIYLLRRPAPEVAIKSKDET